MLPPASKLNQKKKKEKVLLALTDHLLLCEKGQTLTRPQSDSLHTVLVKVLLRKIKSITIHAISYRLVHLLYGCTKMYRIED